MIAELDVNDCLQNCTLRIDLKGVRRMRARLWLCGKILKLAGWIAGFRTQIEVSEGFDAGEPSTWERFCEETEEGGKIVLVRYPEGFRLRYHGETVWRQP